MPNSSALVRRGMDDHGWTAWQVVPGGTSLDWRVSGAADERAIETATRGRCGSY